MHASAARCDVQSSAIPDNPQPANFYMMDPSFFKFGSVQSYLTGISGVKCHFSNNNEENCIELIY